VKNTEQFQRQFDANAICVKNSDHYQQKFDASAICVKNSDYYQQKFDASTICVKNSDQIHQNFDATHNIWFKKRQTLNRVCLFDLLARWPFLWLLLPCFRRLAL